MAKLRKNVAYQSLERPYTRISKFAKKNYVRGGFPALKIVKFEMGDPKRKFDLTLKLNAGRTMNLRHNALESGRVTANHMLEKQLGNNFFFKIRVYPFHILRENPLAAGAGADRMSTGMKKSFGKIIGAAARVSEGQTVAELRINKENLGFGKKALERAAKKFPCSCKVVTY